MVTAVPPLLVEVTTNDLRVSGFWQLNLQDTVAFATTETGGSTLLPMPDVLRDWVAGGVDGDELQAAVTTDTSTSATNEDATRNRRHPVSIGFSCAELSVPSSNIPFPFRQTDASCPGVTSIRSRECIDRSGPILDRSTPTWVKG